MDEAREIAQSEGLTVDSSILDASYQSPFLPSKFTHGVANKETMFGGIYTNNHTTVANSIITHKNTVSLTPHKNTYSNNKKEATRQI